jgi:thiamine biosynthesis lipoprotein
MLLVAAPAAAELVAVEHAAMGTPVAIQIAAPAGHDLPALVAVQAAYAEIERLETLLSSYRSSSDVSRINAGAGGRPVRVSAETLALVLKSIEIGELTDGAFDITFGPLGDLWGFRRAPGVLPSNELIGAARSLVDFRRIQVDVANQTVRLPQAGMRIGLGGIAKGYIVDRAADVIRRHGFRDFMISAGGDLRADGHHFEQPWQVGVQDPRRPDRVIARIPVSNASVVTSGDYERFFILDGRRYHHIIDPGTGMPAAACRSVTILSPDTGIADALATGIFVLGPVEGLGLAERLAGVEALIIDADGKMHTTSGLPLFQQHRPELPPFLAD